MVNSNSNNNVSLTSSALTPRSYAPKDNVGDNQLIVLASDCIGTRCYAGGYQDSEEFNGGDYGYLDVSGLVKTESKPGEIIVGDACSLLHEAIPAKIDCKRTIVRINVER